jgi:hypothetical protein
MVLGKRDFKKVQVFQQAHLADAAFKLALSAMLLHTRDQWKRA